MKVFLAFLLGILLGGAGVGLVVGLNASKLILHERPSPVGLDESVNRIRAAAEKAGWIVQSVLPLDESVKKHGGPEVRPVRLVNLCEPHHAGKLLAGDDTRIVSVMMPCTIAVYEKSDGRVWVASMNAGLLGRLFGGVVSEVMAGDVAEAQQRFVDAVDAAP
jgi:uncharacterized protein (DUF302 family)